MADTTPTYLHIVDCPAGEENAVTAAIHVLGVEFEPEGDPPGSLLAEYAPDGTVEKLAHDLAAVASHTSFRLWSIPSGGQLGRLALHAPPFGLCLAHCDYSGVPVFYTAAEVGEMQPWAHLVPAATPAPDGASASVLLRVELEAESDDALPTPQNLVDGLAGSLDDAWWTLDDGDAYRVASIHVEAVE